MSTFSAVVAMAEPCSALLAKVAPLGVTPTGDPIGRRLLIDVRSTRPDLLEGLARQVADATGASALVLLGQTGADVYRVAEVGAAGPVRRLQFSRDADPPWEHWGSPRPWEADLHFAQPEEDLLEALSDDEPWTDAERGAVKQAYGSRDPARLARLPPLFRATFVAFTEALGVDLERPGARWNPPGFFARLFSRSGR